VPGPAPRSLAAALLFVLALSLAACTAITDVVTGPRQWTQATELVGGETYTIDVRDASGRIDNVEIDPPNVQAPAEGVANPPGQPNVLLVQWTGGACDERTDIAIDGRGQGLEIKVATTVRPVDCDAIGVGHVLRLTAGEPLPADMVTVTTAP
jgi:hypothetical protein